MGENDRESEILKVRYCFVMLLHAKFIVDFIFNVVLFTQQIFRFLFMPFYGHKFTSSYRGPLLDCDWDSALVTSRYYVQYCQP